MFIGAHYVNSVENLNKSVNQRSENSWLATNNLIHLYENVASSTIYA